MIEPVVSLQEYKLTRFEKEVRRYFKKITTRIIRYQDVDYESSVLHCYLFKSGLDHIYDTSTKSNFPALSILIYSILLTSRNLKTNKFVGTSSDMEQDLMNIINRYDSIILHIYDDKFPYKPQDSIFEVFFINNREKNSIIPFRFSGNIGESYPRWFDEKLVQHKKVEVGVDFELIENIKKALS